MIGFAGSALAVVVAVAIEIGLPGLGVYHAGWYNLCLAALVTLAYVASRRCAASMPRARVASVAAAAGTAIVGLAGIVSGLFAPDNQTFVGAPGQRMSVESLGVLAFPLPPSDASANLGVTLARPFHRPMQIGERTRDAGNFILHTTARDVVYVVARDRRGNNLTVTQPNGAVFLSPVLLMNHQQKLAGLELPFDSFSVPAAGRTVKAVMFTPAQAAMLVHGGARLGDAAVLFAVDDQNDRPLPRAIALSAGGRAVLVGGLWLSGTVASYPAVEVVAAPNLLAVVFGGLLVLAALVACVAIYAGSLPRHDRAHVSQNDAALGELDPLGRQHVD